MHQLVCIHQWALLCKNRLTCLPLRELTLGLRREGSHSWVGLGIATPAFQLSGFLCKARLSAGRAPGECSLLCALNGGNRRVCWTIGSVQRANQGVTIRFRGSPLKTLGPGTVARRKERSQAGLSAFPRWGGGAVAVTKHETASFSHKSHSEESTRLPLMVA